jgi:predicted secreted protein
LVYFEIKEILLMYKNIFLSCAMLTCASGLYAQTPVGVVEQNVAKFSFTNAVEVQQDLLLISLNTSREGLDATGVQTELKQALSAAVEFAKSAAVTGQMELRTGSFSLYPRYDKEGKMNGWKGSVELLLEGRDFALITATAGKIKSLTISNISFSLSREQRLRVETDAQAAAIAGFRNKAEQISKSFGFNAYTLREISVNSDNQSSYSPRRMTAMAVSSSSSEPVPAEAGKSTVSVTASGSVQMR